MSADLFEVLSLAARYLFTFLGVLIVLRVFLWLLTDHAEKAGRFRRLPDAGRVGEFVVLSGNASLPEGTVIPVPWEGVLGSVRFCDVVVPCEGVRKRHVSFSFQTGAGLLLRPFSGCEAMVDGTPLNCRSGDSGARMVHGSFLQVGSALLRLRVFAGLDPNSGFEETSSLPAESYSTAGLNDGKEPSFPVYPDNPDFPDQESVAFSNPASSPRRRRSDRWEADWSE